MYIDHEKLEIYHECYNSINSPIEKMMFSNLIVASSRCMTEEAKSFFEENRLRRQAMPQEKIDQYIVDFLIVAINDKDEIVSKLIIECDGHDYHNITKEQAQKDRSRDRKLQSLGYAVLRFTGSEIYNNGIRCAGECLEHLYKNIKSGMTAEV